jgi:hypothetical protein
MHFISTGTTKMKDLDFILSSWHSQQDDITCFIHRKLFALISELNPAVISTWPLTYLVLNCDPEFKLSTTSHNTIFLRINYFTLA